MQDDIGFREINPVTDPAPGTTGIVAQDYDA
jgi:hypothetical protein